MASPRWIDGVDYYGIGLQLDGRVPVVTSAVDWQEMTIAAELFRPSDRVVVAGGGMGSCSALLAGVLGNSSVLTVEPNPTLLAGMRANIHVRGEELQLLAGALAATDGEATYQESENWLVSSLAGYQTRDPVALTYRVATHAITRVLQEFGATALLLDVEGAEQEILPALAFAPYLRAIVVECHPWIYPERLVDRWITQRYSRVIRDHSRPYPEGPGLIIGGSLV